MCLRISLVLKKNVFLSDDSLIISSSNTKQLFFGNNRYILTGVTENAKLVLLIDDYPQISYFIETSLQLDGYEVMTAESGAEALRKMAENPPNLIVLDIRMPDMDGFTLLKKIRRRSDVPVIACSATPEFSAKALESGANAFLSKPIDLDKLPILIEELCA